MTTTRSSAPHVLGVDIGGTHLRLALANESGMPVTRWSASTVGLSDPQVLVGLVQQGCAAALAQADVPRSCLRAVGVGAPGITDVKRGVVLATSYLHGWQNVPLQALLESALGVPVRIENDVNLATLAEATLGEAKAAPDFVFLAIGTGIGAGIFLDGRLHQGSSWLAGEIGYMLFPGSSEDPVEKDAPGTLENQAGGYAIGAAWKPLAESCGLPQDLTATAIFDLAAAGHTPALALLSRTARVLSFALFNLCLVLDVPLIVFGGGVGTHPALLAAVRTNLANYLREATPRLLPSALGSDAQILGAIQLALQVPFTA